MKNENNVSSRKKRNRKVWIQFAGVLLFVLFSPIIVWGISFNIIQLTDNDYGESYARVDGNYVVWPDSGDICLYDISTGISNIIQADGVGHLTIEGDYLAWSRSGNIVLHQISTGSTTQITNDIDHWNAWVDMDDERVVWIKTGSGSSGSYAGHEIYLYDISTGVTTRITDDDQRDLKPSVSGDYVVWYSCCPGSGVYLYQISTGTTTQIANYGKWHDIDGDRVVYGTAEGQFVYDIPTSTSTFISNNAYNPHINGDYITFESNINYREVVLYQITTGTTTQITDNPDGYSFLNDMDGGRVVIEAGGNDSDLYVYEISTGITTQLTDNDYDDYNAIIDGDNIVWVGDYNSEDLEIFLATLTNDTLAGLSEMLQALVTEGVIAEELEKSLLVKVENAEKVADKDNIGAAINDLVALQNQIEAQRGNKISNEAADQVIAYSGSLIAYFESKLF
jgi:hypothetical protein